MIKFLLSSVCCNFSNDTNNDNNDPAKPLLTNNSKTKYYGFNQDVSKQYKPDGTSIYFHADKPFITQSKTTKNSNDIKQSTVSLGKGAFAEAFTQSSGNFKSVKRKIYKLHISTSQQKTLTINRLFSLKQKLESLSPDIFERLIIPLHLTPKKSVMQLAPGKQVAILIDKEVKTIKFIKALKTTLLDMQALRECGFILSDRNIKNMSFDGNYIYNYDLDLMDLIFINGEDETSWNEESESIELLFMGVYRLCNANVNEDNQLNEKIKSYIKYPGFTYDKLVH